MAACGLVLDGDSTRESSSSMIWVNSCIGAAPNTGIPLTKKAGVPVMP
jgi:hypothetical protein